MAWDPEKYREKREKVLGIRKRGISFSSMAVVISIVILTGAAWVSVPQAVSYMKTRHLDDAIYKLEGNGAWPGAVLAELSGLAGVRRLEKDTHGTRLVVTFDRRETDVRAFAALFEEQRLTASLLNRTGHRQRQTLMASEKELESETL